MHTGTLENREQLQTLQSGRGNCELWHEPWKPVAAVTWTKNLILRWTRGRIYFVKWMPVQVWIGSRLAVTEGSGLVIVMLPYKVNSVLELIGNTPLVRINRMNPVPGVEILVKLEMMNPGGSVKDRIGLTDDRAGRGHRRANARQDRP